jgi:Carbon-nitrogen hydrolase
LKITVVAVQMPCEPWHVATNVERADGLLDEAHRAGTALAVLPELFNTGYGLIPDFTPYAEGIEGPTLQHLSRRSRQWRMGIAGGFVERDGRHLYDALALCLPDGSVHIYRKRHLVFWEPFRFRAGRLPLVVPTPWGTIGLAICADMIRSPVWNDYRGRLARLRLPARQPPALAVRRSWPTIGPDPGQGRAGPRRASYLLQPMWRHADHHPSARSGSGSGDRRPVRRPEQHLRRAELSPGHRRGRTAARSVRRRPSQFPRSPLMAFYVAVGPRGLLFQVGMILTGLMGPLTYWLASRRRAAVPVTPWSWPEARPPTPPHRASPSPLSSIRHPPPVTPPVIVRPVAL